LKELKAVRKQLTAREDEIARRAEQRASLDAEQEEYAERAAQAEESLADAEARVRELTEQCKALRKQAEAGAGADMLVKEKDEIINEVMAEGEALSKKQAEMEGIIKKLRKDLREREEAHQGLSRELESKGASISKLTAELKAARDEYVADKTRLTTQLNEQKEYYLSKLAQAKEELTDVEIKANVARSEDLASELKIVREREQSLKDQLADLQHSLQRSSAALERQEERFKNDLAAVEERCQLAESSHDELLRRMPESTRPLLRQIEALQLQATENADAWTATERASALRLADAESRAEAAAEREATAIDEKMSAMKDTQIAMNRAEKLKAEIDALNAELEVQRAKASAEAVKSAKFSESFAEQEGQISVVEEEARERESKVKQLLAQERGKHKQLGETWDRERAEMLAATAKLESDLKLARDEVDSLQSKYDGDRASENSAKAAPAPMLTGGEAGLSLAVRDTLAALKSQLAARDTDLHIAHDQIKKLEQTRDSLANELVKSEQLADGGAAVGVSAALEKRYAAALEVIGEREEECDELRDRIQHLRAMLDSQAQRISALELAASTSSSHQ
jgi:chromosome segregation ATPase